MRCVILRLVDVRKYVGGELVLDRVGLNVGRGDIVVVRGRSGVGKTTLARVAALIEPPDDGSVIFNGMDLSRASDRVRSSVRLRYIGYVDQFFKLIPEMTVLENVEVPMKLLGIPKDVRRERALDALEALGLKSKASSFPNQLSGGEKQRVAIARAVAKQPLLLVMDEPFSNLDEVSEANTMNLLKDLARNGVGVLITTTDLYKQIYSSKDFILINKQLVLRDAVRTP